MAADNTVDAITFIGRIVLWSQYKFFPNPDPAPARFEFLNPVKFGSAWILNNPIRYNSTSSTNLSLSTRLNTSIPWWNHYMFQQSVSGKIQ